MQYYKVPDSSLESGFSLHALEVGVEPATVTDFPKNAIAITEEEAEALRPKPNPAAIIEAKKQAVREARKPVFYTLAGMQSEALTKGDAATAAAIVGIQQSLKDLPETDLSACTNATEVDAAFVAAWLAIAQSAPANVVSAFNEVLA